MQFPSLDDQIDALIGILLEREPFTEREMRTVVSPYRICALGGHVDHQGGAVLGKAINAYSIMVFSPVDTGLVKIHSANFEDPAAFEVGEQGAPDYAAWARYAKGAVHVLGRDAPLERGIIGAVGGTLPGGGLSSSASVGLAYLVAIAAANGRVCSPEDLVELDRRLENDYLGLQNGILDQSTIVNARRDTMVHIDTRTREATHVADPPNADAYRMLIAYSGYARELTSTGFNQRVQECRQAARLLGEWGHLEDASILSDVPYDLYAAYKQSMPATLMRRAEHYFSEAARVEDGRSAWERGDMDAFGALLDASCSSSIYNYECGSDPMKDLHEIVSAAEGCYGSRFMGGGYGGCVLGFVDSASAEQAAEDVMKQYVRKYPEVRDDAAVYIAQPEDGIRLL